MPTVREELIINAPIEKVWDVLTDFGNYAAWNPFVQNIELNAELKEGSPVILHALMKPGAPASPVAATLAEVQAPHTLNWRGGVGPAWLARGYHFHQLEQLADGSTRVVHGETFSGLLFALIWPLQGKTFDRTYKKVSEALKLRCSAV